MRKAQTTGAIVILGLLVAVLALSGSLPFSVGLSQNPTVVHEMIETETITPGFKMGVQEFNMGEPVFDCQVDGEPVVISYPEMRSCWKASVNDKLVPIDSDIVPNSQYRLKNTQVRASVFCELGECDFVRAQDWKIQYDVFVAQDSVNLAVPGVSQATLDVSKTFTIGVNNGLPQGVTGGLNVLVEERILQQTNSFVVKAGLDNAISFERTFDTIGKKTITVTPFLDVYDYRQGFTQEDTGLCSQGSNRLFCVKTARITVGESKTFTVFAAPASCESDQDCGGNFNCQSNECVLEAGADENGEDGSSFFDFIRGLFNDILQTLGLV